MNGVWGPMHLGLKTGPVYPLFYTRLKEPYFFNKVPDGPYTLFSNIFRFQKEETEECMSV
jgi:hypothetical protein